MKILDLEKYDRLKKLVIYCHRCQDCNLEKECNELCGDEFPKATLRIVESYIKEIKE